MRRVLPFHSFTSAVTVFAVGLMVTACSGDLGTDPDAKRVALAPAASSAVTIAAAGLEGCATLEVELTGRTGIQVRDATGEPCGPLRVRLDTTPTFDRTDGRIRLPLVVENVGETRVRAPVLLGAWEDSLAILAPPGLSRAPGAEGVLELAKPDSVVPVDAETWPEARIWKFGEEVPESEVDPPATQRFARRWVEVAVHDGVRELSVALRLRGERELPLVPAVPPDTMPADAFGEIAPNGVMSVDVLVVQFRQTATLDQKQEAIALVNGTVIGGLPAPPEISSSLEGFYVIRIPGDGTSAGMNRALEQLRALPQVLVAVPNVVLRPNYRKPEDGPGWRDWEVDPQLASVTGENWAPEQVGGPLAWGCETGSTQFAIAVVDLGFGTPTDLSPNLISPSRVPGRSRPRCLGNRGHGCPRKQRKVSGRHYGPPLAG